MTRDTPKIIERVFMNYKELSNKKRKHKHVVSNKNELSFRTIRQHKVRLLIKCHFTASGENPVIFSITDTNWCHI